MPQLKSRRTPGGPPRSSGRQPIRDPSGIVYFRAGFDGNPDGVRQGRAISPGAARCLKYQRVGSLKALAVSEGTRVRYDLGRGFPHGAGCLEFRFKPNFPQTSEQPERTVLRLWGRGGCSIALSFQPIGYAWEFLVKGPREKHSLRAWYGVARQGKWSHFLLVWDQGARPRPALTFYYNGKVAYGSMRAFHSSPLRGLTCLEVGGTGKGQVVVDEVTIYSRPLSQEQARFLSSRFREPDRRFAELAERIGRDERREQAQAERRRALLKKLEGKVGGLLQLRGHKPHEIAFPEGVRAAAVRPEDVGEADLSRFSVIHFPPGGNYQLTDEEKRRIVAYVKGGGGYVGVCMGAYTAHKLGLLNFECHTFYEVGLTQLNLEKHPVTEGCGERIHMHHGNGPIMIPGKGCEVVGTYRMEGVKGRPGAILVGQHGKGRVVLFGPHPQGGGVSAAGKRVGFTGEDLETDRLLVNALLYAAKVTGRDRKMRRNREGAG